MGIDGINAGCDHLVEQRRADAGGTGQLLAEAGYDRFVGQRAQAGGRLGIQGSGHGHDAVAGQDAGPGGGAACAGHAEPVDHLAGALAATLGALLFVGLLRPRSGLLRGVGAPIALPETSEGFITPLSNGNVIVTTSGAISSIFYYMVNRILPERLQVDGPPEAGLLLLEPR